MPAEFIDSRRTPLNRDTDYYTDGVTGRTVYLPRGYKATTMMIGFGKTAVATSWGDPWNVIDDENINDVSLAAPIRTISGLSVMLVNLARNPDIRNVVLWTGGANDKGDDALIPQDCLAKLFSSGGGIEDDGRIVGTQYFLPQELVLGGGIDVVRKVLSNVNFVTEHQGNPIDDKSLLNNIVASLNNDAGMYMEPHIFPEIEISTPEALPSREVSPIISAHKITDGWLRLLQHITEYGPRCQLETGGAEVKEVRFARVIIDRQQIGTFELPEWVQDIDRLGFTIDKLEDYYHTKIRPEVNLVEIYDGVKRFERPPVSYLYSELLHNYPRSKDFDNYVIASAKTNGINQVADLLRLGSTRALEGADTISEQVVTDTSLDDAKKAEILLEVYYPTVNQIERVVNQIKTMPDDADKMFVLWVPETHGMQNRGRPCFTQGSMLVRNGKIDMKVNFRSHDIAKGWLENVYGAWRLLEDIAKETGYEVGQLIVDSESAHYYLADHEWVSELVDKQVYQQQPVKVYQKEEWGDPRGNWSVNVVGNEIVCLLLDPQTGQPLREFKERTVKSMIAGMRHLKIMDDADHALDLGVQLANAEFCLLTGMPFTQDRSLDFRTVRDGLKRLQS